MDEIRIRELQVYANHGVFQEEKEKGQNFYINATLYMSTRKAGLSDALEDSVNYADVALFIDKYMKEHTVNLLECIAEKMAEAILLKFSLIDEIELEIRKPEAPIPLPFGSVSVCIRRGWHEAYIALGSNMGDKRGYIDGAIKALDKREDCQVMQVSELIETEPYGVTDQDVFLNGALKLRTLLPPDELLDVLNGIELEAKRERKIHWGPRTLDLDIIFYDSIVMDTPRLTIPHPDMHNRTFVLEPLAQLNRFYRHPLFGTTVGELLSKLQA